MIRITRRINLKDGGYMSVTSDDPDSALQIVVGWVIDDGLRPPKWWQFWLPAWPKDAVEEYRKQAAQEIPE